MNHYENFSFAAFMFVLGRVGDTMDTARTLCVPLDAPNYLPAGSMERFKFGPDIEDEGGEMTTVMREPWE